MNTQRVAAALNTLSLGIAELAEAIQSEAGERSEAMAATPAATTGATQTPPPELSPFEDETPTWTPPETLPEQGSLAVCPKHHVPFTEGSYGPYCKQATDDPAWGKQKGDRLWCKITPRNAAEYLRIKAAA